MDVQAISKPPVMAAARIKHTLATIKNSTPASNRGWLFHFVDSRGQPIGNTEVSSIDTAIFYSGALQAAGRLKNKELIDYVQNEIQKIDIQWMIDNSPSKKRICHGFHYVHGRIKFISCEWDEYNEGIIAYHLFDIPYHPTKYNYSLPLFAYYYPLCFIHGKGLEKHLEKALQYQQTTFGKQGITSMDTQEGYQFYPTHYISPIALYICNVRSELPPIVHAYNTITKWQSTDRIGIEEGAAILRHREF